VAGRERTGGHEAHHAGRTSDSGVTSIQLAGNHPCGSKQNEKHPIDRNQTASRKRAINLNFASSAYAEEGAREAMAMSDSGNLAPNIDAANFTTASVGNGGRRRLENLSLQRS
jgi:hypothetical protein